MKIYVINHFLTVYASQFMHVKRFGKAMIEHLREANTFKFNRCEHTEDLLNVVIKKYVDNCMNQYLKKINRILSGKESIAPNTNDSLMLQATKLV